jgi:hypothetical protein
VVPRHPLPMAIQPTNSTRTPKGCFARCQPASAPCAHYKGAGLLPDAVPGLPAVARPRTLRSTKPHSRRVRAALSAMLYTHTVVHPFGHADTRNEGYLNADASQAGS